MEENKETPKKKSNVLFTLFACVMTGIIVFLATNIGQKASKVVDPDVKSSGKKSNVTSNVESNATSNTSNTAASSKTIADIKGNYTFTQSDVKTNDGSHNYTCRLTLYENAVYEYNCSLYAPSGTIGNYYVTDNTISLVTWFETASSAEVYVPKTNSVKTLTINADGTITDTEVSDELKNANVTSKVLTKDSTAVSTFDLSSRLNNNAIVKK